MAKTVVRSRLRSRGGCLRSVEDFSDGGGVQEDGAEPLIPDICSDLANDCRRPGEGLARRLPVAHLPPQSAEDHVSLPGGQGRGIAVQLIERGGQLHLGIGQITARHGNFGE